MGKWNDNAAVSRRKFSTPIPFYKYLCENLEQSWPICQRSIELRETLRGNRENRVSTVIFCTHYG